MRSLAIRSFTNADHRRGWRPGNNSGGTTLFKALGHPAVAGQAREWRASLSALSGRLAVYDPLGDIGTVDAFLDIRGLRPAGYYVQQVEHLGGRFADLDAQPVTALPDDADVLLLAAFDDGGGLAGHLAGLVGPRTRTVTLDPLRLPAHRLTVPGRYLDPRNFATNFALLRDAGGLHTRVVTANYWGTGAAGGEGPTLWCRLMGEDGDTLAEWDEALGPADGAVVIDSADIRDRFGLGDYCGSLFLHAVGAPVHDVVKYALDTYGDGPEQLSCTHDANAWPAEFYAGVPAPEADERLLLWVQNSHPIEIPAGAVGFNRMGRDDEVRAYPESIPPFGVRGIDVGGLLPDARFPEQIEIRAGEYFVRPRYEVVREPSGRRRIAHANVERTDLRPDPAIRANASHLGRGYIMPLPLLPLDAFATVCLPAPMATGQAELPVRVELFDPEGRLVASEYLGRIARRDSVAVDIDAWLAAEGVRPEAGSGHIEFLYDFRGGGEADGWLHALARIEQRSTGHRAETIFGAHLFNTPLVFRDEPQSYAGRPPGLTTRLFLRLGDGVSEGTDTMCHLIHPSSMPHSRPSDTELRLVDAEGVRVAEARVRIPCGGSRHLRYGELFPRGTRERAGPNAHIVIRDATCRLFGFHGLLRPEVSFSLDHMFGY